MMWQIIIFIPLCALSTTALKLSPSETETLEDILEKLVENQRHLLQHNVRLEEEMKELRANQIVRLEEEMKELRAEQTSTIQMIHNDRLCQRPKRCYGPDKGITTIVTGCHNKPLPQPADVEVKDIYCDDQTDGGGWILFLQRFDGSVNFTQTWNEYRNGFGNLNGEFWLGLETIHKLTRHNQMELRVDMEYSEGNKAYAVYNDFKILNESDGYRLEVADYTGNAGDALSLARMNFSTIDKVSMNPDYPCGVHYGWWGNSYCTATQEALANLNAPYLPSDGRSTWFWHSQLPGDRSLKSAEMKIRPASYQQY